jgi:signal transduction histidine kinase
MTAAITLPGRAPGLRRTTAAFLAAAVAYWALYASWLILQPGGEEGLRYLSNVVYHLAPAVATVTLALAAAKSSGRARLGWGLASFAMAAWAAGEWAWSSYDLFLNAEVPTPSVAEPMYYTGYIAMSAALVVLVQPARNLQRQGKSVLDALIVVLILGTLSWKLVLAPISESGDVASIELLTNLGYPLLDLGMVIVVLTAFYRANWRLPLPVLFLAGTALLNGVADTLYLRLSFVEEYYPSGNPIDMGWVIGYSLAGIGGFLHWQGAQTEASDEDTARAEVHSAVGLALPYVLAIPLLGLQVEGVASGDASLVVTLGATAVLVAVAGRQWFTLTENAALYSRVAAQEEARRLLLDEIVDAQEKERRRIALELHDDPIQSLTHAGIRLSSCRKFLEKGDSERCIQILEDVEGKLNDETQGLRQLMSALHPPVLDERGVGAAIRDFADGVQRESSLAVHVSIEETGRLESSLETTVYRIVQEALSNVRRHAEAATVRVTLRRAGDDVEVAIQDDGKGFSVQDSASLAKEGHFGLLGMHQRAELIGGNCSVESAPGMGTLVTVRVPADPGAVGVA